MTKTLVRYGLFALSTLIVSTCSLVLLAVSQHTSKASAGAPTCTWTGAGGNTNFSTAGNWTCESGTVPVDGTTVIFNYSNTPISANNDTTGLELSGIVINAVHTSSSGGSVNIDGNELGLLGDIDVSADVSDGYFQVRVNTSLTLGSDANIVLNEAPDLPYDFFLGDSADTVNLGTYNMLFSLGGSPNYVGSPSIGAYVYVPVVGSGNLTFTGLSAVNTPWGHPMNSIGLGNYGTAASTVSGAMLFDNVRVSTSYASSATENDGRPFGASAGASTFTNGSTVLIDGASSTPISVSENMIFDANSTSTDYRLGVQHALAPGSPYSFTENYLRLYNSQPVTFSGNVTTGTSLNIQTDSPTTFSGNLDGAGQTIGRYEYFGSGSRAGSVIINGSANTTATPNGTNIGSTIRSSTLSDSQSASTVYIGYGYKISVDGQRGNIELRTGGILSGIGIVGAVVSYGGTIQPGASPEVLDTGNISLDSTSSLDAEIGGTATGEYDQLNVTGTVSLGSATLNVLEYNSFIPTLNDTFTIINNDGSDAVTGTFAGHAEGTTYVVGDVTYTISYVGGTGNDVVLTATTTPGPPDTAGVLARPTNLLIAGGVIATGAGLFIIRQKYLAKTRKSYAKISRR